ncbi:hypothetical protein Y032_0009g580 [Ancylostoma ceylanicum]|uniref:Uncharacterized protein n=1 Tax=Ancylostoma ceylanicum TaxID=53326 RepID=A0A016VKC2_9BILA|nr:hypothetical protein Y032_0009g580 [Ancylostoma ceylanicum]
MLEDLVKQRFKRDRFHSDLPAWPLALPLPEQSKTYTFFAVAFVTVTNATEKGKKKVYDLLYETYFDVNDKPAPRQWSVRRTITIECDRVKLRVGDDYFLGCKSENTDCKFVRPYGDLTTTENKLLKLQ